MKYIFEKICFDHKFYYFNLKSFFIFQDLNSHFSYRASAFTYLSCYFEVSFQFPIHNIFLTSTFQLQSVVYVLWNSHKNSFPVRSGIDIENANRTWILHMTTSWAPPIVSNRAFHLRNLRCERTFIHFSRYSLFLVPLEVYSSDILLSKEIGRC